MHKSTFLYLHLNLRLGDSLSSLVEFDLLARDQTLLQCASNLHCGHSTLQPHRRRRVVQAAGREFVGLGDEGVPESTVIVRWDLAPDPAGLVDVDQVRGRLGVDGQLACCSGDFGGCRVSMDRISYTGRSRGAGLQSS